jgi:RNA polymerase sigma factor (sigma-70 family)
MQKRNEARHLVVGPHGGLAKLMAFRYYWAVSASLAKEDLMQEAIIAAWQREQRPMPDGVATGTVLGRAMQGAINRNARKMRGCVAIPKDKDGAYKNPGAARRIDLDLTRFAAEEDDSPSWRADKLELLIDELPPRERGIIRERYFGDKSLADIGRDMGLTRERVRQLEKRALGWLKESIARAEEECNVRLKAG